MQRVLVVGATSAIAQSFARRCAMRGDTLHLMARNKERLNTLAKDLAVRGAADVKATRFNAADICAVEAAVQDAVATLGGIDVALIAHGTLPDQETCQRDAGETIEAFSINAVSAVVAMGTIANHLEQQGSGTLAVIGSVAGDRGRRSNYVYGAAKGAVAICAQGLRGRLYRAGARVLVVKPGFVDTPMTSAFKKGPLWASPDKVAKDIDKAIRRKKHTLYTPWFWRWIMLIIKSIPELIFKRLSL